MKTRNITYILIISILFFNSASAEGPAKKLTLNDCINIACEKNRRLLNAGIRRDIAKLNIRKTTAACLPAVDAGAMYYKNGLLPADSRLLEDNYQNKVRLTQTVFNKRVFVLYNQTKINLNAEDENLKEEMNSVKLDVKEKYYLLLKAEKTIELQKQAVTLMKEHLKAAEVLYKNGLSVETDILRAEMEVSNMEKNLLSAVNQKNAAYEDLCLVLGIDEDSDFEVEDDLTEAKEPLSGLDSLREKATETRPLLKKNRENLLSSKESIKLAKADFWPKVSMSASYNWNGGTFLPKEDEWNVYLNFDIDIFNGGLDHLEIKEAGYKYEEAKNDLLQSESALKAEIESIYAKLKESYEFINITGKIEKIAEKNFSLIREKYEKGLVTNSVVIEAFTQYLSAKNSKIAADYDYRIFLARLEKAIGGENL